MVKTFFIVSIISLIFGLAIFSGIMVLFPDSVSMLRTVIEYTPIEMRVSIFLLFLGIMIFIGKNLLS